MKIIIRTLLLLLCFSANSLVAQQKQPNILFIAIDDMNDWTGFLGGHSETITPNMDKLSKIGVNFTNAHTSAPGCSPSRNALLYGVQPFNSGLYPFYEHDIHEQLMQQYTSLPRLLKENGYNTYGAGKIHHKYFQPPVSISFLPYRNRYQVEASESTSIKYLSLHQSPVREHRSDNRLD